MLLLLAEAQFSTCFPVSLSHIHLATSLYLCPANCFQGIMFRQRESLMGTSWDFLDIASDTPALWAHDGTSLDINKANGMLTRNTKGIFCLPIEKTRRWNADWQR